MFDKFFAWWYRRNGTIRCYAKKTLEWFHELEGGDERKKTFVSNGHAVIKAEVVANSLVFSIHVKVKEGDMFLWKYQKYSIVNSSVSGHDEPILMVDEDHVVVKGRAGKYSFKQ